MTIIYDVEESHRAGGMFPVIVYRCWVSFHLQEGPQLPGEDRCVWLADG